MKKLLLILLMPMIGFGQCIKGDCENGLGLYFWPDGSYTNGSWKHGSPHGIIQKIDVHEGKLIKSFEFIKSSSLETSTEFSCFVTLVDEFFSVAAKYSFIFVIY